MGEKCIFCEIVKGNLKSDKVYEDQDVIVIRDISPQAPTHLLVIPKVHIPSAAEVGDPDIWAKLMNNATIVARKLGLDKGGYRLVINCGSMACQTVPHLHMHLLAGRQFHWPPG
jgi:histidine triad (HIT) family protein